MSLVVVTAATEYPVSLAEAKAHLRVEHDDDNTFIDGCIAAACDFLQPRDGALDYSLMRQTYRYGSPRWPLCGESIRLVGAVPGQTAVTSVKFSDDVNAEQTVSPSDYFLTDSGRFLCFVDSFTRESLYRREDAVRVTYTAGYTDPTLVPARLLMAVKFLVARLYADRGERVDQSMIDDPMLSLLIAPYRRIPA